MSVDHVTEALAKLPSQFQGLPGWTGAITALVTPIQLLEDTIQAVLLQRYIDNATGAQLRMIGKLVGQPWDGVTGDDLYRRYIKARIAANRSSGTGEEVIKISILVIDDEDARHVVTNLGNAAMLLTVQDVETDDDVAAILISVLRKAVLAGVRIILITLADLPADSFAFANPITFVDGAQFAGATTLVVDSTDGFDNAGALIVSWGTAVPDLLSYSGKTPTTFTGVDNPFFGGSGTHFNQPDRAAVQQYDLGGTEHHGFALATFVAGAHLAGVTTLNVDSTTDFPSSGTIRIDVGTATEELLSYTGTTPTTFTGVEAISEIVAHPPGTGTILAHADRGAVVCPVPGTDATNEPFSGGKLAGAVI